MRFNSLDEWLAWQEQLHPVEIDLGLERVQAVATTLLGSLVSPQLPATVITVAGTNGKGSCIAMLEAIYLAAGYSVGAYTSPHLLRYNERIRINGVAVEDDLLCQSFDRIDQARNTISLSYFEFGTLAAIDIFNDDSLDIVLLEVGLGGRLDAVNIIDSQVGLISSIALDHVAILGDNRESIAAEKAGIMRKAVPLVCGDSQPPENLFQLASDYSCELYCQGRDFSAQVNHDMTETREPFWSWQGASQHYDNLPYPALASACQLDNAASVLMVVALLSEIHPIEKNHICHGLKTVSLPGRFQIFSNGVPDNVTTILDVAHNPQATSVLAQSLREQGHVGKSYAVLGMMADKDICGALSPLCALFDGWYVAPLSSSRSCQVAAISSCLVGFGQRAVACDSMVAAWRMAADIASSGDRIVVFGSFLAVSEVYSELSYKFE